MKQKGFTLIELVMVIALFSIIAVVSTKILLMGFIGYTTAEANTDADWQGRMGIERMTRDIRTVRSAADITTASASQFVFNDINGVSVNYRLSGTTLLRNTQTLADGISGLSFAYLDKNGATTATLSLIEYVTLTLTISQNNTNTVLKTTINLRDVS